MGILNSQVSSNQHHIRSGAQVIDGSLKFDEDNNTYLKVTPGSNGNRKTWTWSGWVKKKYIWIFFDESFLHGRNDIN